MNADEIKSNRQDAKAANKAISKSIDVCLHRQEKASKAQLSTVRCKAWLGINLDKRSSPRGRST
jgi:hypothetical protein